MGHLLARAQLLVVRSPLASKRVQPQAGEKCRQEGVLLHAHEARSWRRTEIIPAQRASVTAGLSTVFVKGTGNDRKSESLAG